VLLVCLAVLLAAPAPARYLREQLFDAWQRIAPRERVSGPAVVVEIDERSLDARGQWPWPRTLVAQLIREIARAEPAAIGVDALFVEADRHSPDADAELAAAILGAPVVLPVAGLPHRDRRFPSAPLAAPVRLDAAGAPRLPSYAGHLQSRDELQRAARGWGLISAVAGTGVIRRAPMLGRVGDTLLPSLSAEMLRVAIGVPLVHVRERGGDALELAIGELAIPLQADGSLWIRFGSHDPGRFVSAEQVLSGAAPAQLLRGKLVLVGVTGLGLVDQQLTPLGERMPGVEIHAQVLEQVFDGNYLRRPAGARWIEAALLLALGALLLAAVPRLRPWTAALLGAGSLVALFATGLGAFRAGWLIDAAAPALGAALVFATLLAATLAEADRQRRTMREAQARMTGELEAAKRIQTGLMPAPRRLFAAETAFAMEAMLEPARTVGGDFYDCFKLDLHRVFFLVADVSGKGMPAALFMALSKAILKANALRGASELGVSLTHANAEVSRENPEALFVTLFAGILDLRTGMLEYSNAGHEPPLSRKPGGGVERFDIAGGPPLCVMDDFEYQTGYRQLAPGEWICVVTDGITEAMNSRGELYGGARLAAALSALGADADPAALAAALREDVRRFVGDAEPSDDLTLLCLRWNGPSSADAGPGLTDDLDVEP